MRLWFSETVEFSLISQTNEFSKVLSERKYYANNFFRVTFQATLKLNHADKTEAKQTGKAVPGVAGDVSEILFS